MTDKKTNKDDLLLRSDKETGLRLRRALHNLGWSQMTAARRLGLPQATISNMLNGKADVKLILIEYLETVGALINSVPFPEKNLLTIKHINSGTDAKSRMEAGLPAGDNKIKGAPNK